MVNHPNRALTPSLRKMLEWIADSGECGIMLLQITASGGREGAKLQKLRNLGWVEYCDIQLSRSLVDGVRATEAGRAALRGR